MAGGTGYIIPMFFLLISGVIPTYMLAANTLQTAHGPTQQRQSSAGLLSYCVGWPKLVKLNLPTSLLNLALGLSLSTIP